jgi:hypothetical protein
VVLTVIAYLVSTAVLAPVVFFVVIALAGPHSSMLPSIVQPAVVVLGWLTVIVAPVLIARAVWRRTRAAR